MRPLTGRDPGRHVYPAPRIITEPQRRVYDVIQMLSEAIAVEVMVAVVVEAMVAVEFIMENECPTERDRQVAPVQVE